MLTARTERARLGKRLLVTLYLLALGGTLSVAAQTGANQVAPSARPPSLPKSCLEQSQPSDKITALLDSVHDHPTAGAYNTLGALYAQADRVSCAVVAFESALKLQDPTLDAETRPALRARGGQARRSLDRRRQSAGGSRVSRRRGEAGAVGRSI